ncbi:MAG TPA: Rieske 2Fe-2S domain-containing protein [Chloroflexota bacterium]|nr:Rieske 2Fe-2S domain-containing protein [Chloroflexota bacterium]
MLSQADNELLTRVGPGTDMGNLFRQYWLPAFLSSELPEPDCDPMRLRLLGEDLVAFRDTAGRVGVLAMNCAHRGASLFFGRNEESGLRCVYHGWKFDVTGRCVDMPNEPPESSFKDKVRQRAYPCQERNGTVWVYMGPRSQPPDFPRYEWAHVPEGHYAISKTLRECNWAQAFEGDMDDAHVPALHSFLKFEYEHGSANQYYGKPLYLQVSETPYGLLSGSRRDAEEGKYNWRITPVLFPSSSMFTVGTLRERGVLWIRMWIPIDDENTAQWRIRWKPDAPLEGPDEPESGPGGYLPRGTHWHEQWRPAGNKTNDYFIDREAQKKESFSGIPGFPLQDKMATESMGPIMDRTVEHLGSTDTVIIAMRRRLLAAAKALRENGVTPPGVDQPEAFAVRSAIVNLPVELNWVEASREMILARAGAPAVNQV